MQERTEGRANGPVTCSEYRLEVNCCRGGASEMLLLPAVAAAAGAAQLGADLGESFSLGSQVTCLATVRETECSKGR